ncbi:MAG: protoporphyrinogen oxidase [Pyrinomonadaceae bacterium]
MTRTPSGNTRKVVIIGGGISGLAAAHRLAEQRASVDSSFEVLLLEASSRLGGIIRTERREGFLLEGGPDSFISEKPEALALAKRVGIADRVIETNAAHRRSFIVRGGRLHGVPEGFQLLAPSRFWPFVTSGIFSWSGKARMALDLVLPKRADANGKDDESLAQFVRRRLGREALERMAQPMVGGIYTADPERLSLRATMPRFLEMESAHGSIIKAMLRARRKQNAEAKRGTSGARYSLFLSFDEGMQMLVDGVAAKLPENSTRLNAPVESLAFDEAARRWMIRIKDSGETIHADALCLALPTFAAANLLRDTDEQLASELNEISYASTATINLAYKRADISHALDGFGFVSPLIEGRATLACSFSSVKFAGRAPEGYVLLRAFVGGALQPEMFELEDGQIIAAVREDLRALLGIKTPPLFSFVQRWPRSMPQYHLGHLERIERINARLANFPTLAIAGNAYNGAGVPDCIRSGEKAADAMLANLALR